MKQEWAVVSIREKRKEHYVTLSDGNTNGHADMGDDNNNENDDRNARKA